MLRLLLRRRQVRQTLQLPCESRKVAALILRLLWLQRKLLLLMLLLLLQRLLLCLALLLLRLLLRRLCLALGGLAAGQVRGRPG